MQQFFNIPMDIDINKQAASDISKRSMAGCFVYIACWLIIVLPTGFFKEQPLFTSYFTLFLMVVGLFRFMLIRKFEQLYSFNPKVWTVMIYSNVIISALAWGTLCSASISVTEFSSLSILLMFSLAGTTAGGAVSLSPDLKMATALIFTLLMPSIVTIVASNKGFDFPLCLLFISFIIGMVFVMYAQNKEYWKALNSSVLIMNYAAKLEDLNTLDSLTGLRNRKFFDEELIKEIKRAERRGTEISLVLMDLDHFKGVNDTYGHLAGDKCLKDVADIFNKVVKRETDTIVRYGGEEFAVILPELSEQQSFRFAESIRTQIEETAVLWSNISIFLTISIGISTTKPRNNFSHETLIKSADEALYRAKKEGRNRVVSQTI